MNRGAGYSLMLGCVMALSLGSCGAPPLSTYTLAAPPTAAGNGSFGKTPTIISVAPVTVPDELDTQDIVVRNGSTLRRSQLGRWASRLSIGITDRMTERLAAQRPEALVTDRQLADTPSFVVRINIARLDVTAAGVVTLDADWSITAHDAAIPTRRERAHFVATGSVATDQDVVTLLELVLDRLAAAIRIPTATKIPGAIKIPKRR